MGNTNIKNVAPLNTNRLKNQFEFFEQFLRIFQICYQFCFQIWKIADPAVVTVFRINRENLAKILIT